MSEQKKASRRVEGISISAITGWTVDQAECVENTQPLPQLNQYFYFAKAYGWKKPFEGGAGTVPLQKGEESGA